MESKIEKNLKVDSNIINELSDNIPNNLIALNELIKNSYDAGAKEVNIIFDSQDKQLIVSDNGHGMASEDIDTLLHVSKSNKKYGSISPYHRHIQGSKGLGFLSAFKFGGNIIWETKKDNFPCYKFSINRSEILEHDDITNYNLVINESNNKDSQGTDIFISLDDYNIKSLIDFFSNSKNLTKTLYSFSDADFTININIDKKIYSSINKPSSIDELPERQIFNVKYSSTFNKLEFIINDSTMKKEIGESLFIDFPFKSKINIRNDYNLNLNITIFKLRSYDKSKINNFYLNDYDDLTPLIYVNSNLFNNYRIFNPNIMRNVRVGDSLSQMIGEINVNSETSDLKFNSDRTSFTSNELTDSIVGFLASINTQIQDFGSWLWRLHTKQDFFKKVNEIPLDILDSKDKLLDYVLKGENNKYYNLFEVDINKGNNSCTIKVLKKEQIFNIKKKIDPCHIKKITTPHQGVSLNNTDKRKATTSTDFKSAVIILSKNIDNFTLPSKQIDLSEYIQKATNSLSEEIKYDNISLFIDEINVDNYILESIDHECKKQVLFSYNDINTGIAQTTLILNFHNPESLIKTSSLNKKIIKIPAKIDYSINFNSTIDNLVAQINSLDIRSYRELISCSMRCIFEISIDSIIKNNYPMTKKTLEDRIKEVIDCVSTDNNFKSKLSNNTKIDYKSLNNLLDDNSGNVFYTTIKKCHLSAHKATEYLNSDILEDLGKRARLFLVITNEIIKNNWVPKN